MAENTKKPAIRFAGFSEAWEQRKLDTITDVRDGTHDSPQYVEDGHPFITSKNVKDGFINYEDIQYVSDKDYEEINKRSKVDKNDILMGMIGTIGNIALVRETPDFTIKNVALIKDIGDVFYHYLYHCLQSNSVAHQLDENLDGGTQKFIALNKIRELVIPVPSEYEQHKIGDYMELLDNLITLHQRKYDKLTNVKKSMLEKMFPKNGSNVPEIRFKGFTEAWKQRKLGEIAEIRRGLTYKPDDVKTSGIRVLRSSNINEEYFETYKDDVFVDEVAINIPYVKNGDIIITSANGSSRLVGKHAIIKNIPDNSMVHGGFMLVASTNEPEFLNSSMSSPWYAKFINIYVAGGNGAIGNLSKSDLDNQEILVPSVVEQQKIGAYFRNLDNLITLHQRKLEKLRNIKKSMLEKMFI
jgi:hypothetical protein